MKRVLMIIDHGKLGGVEKASFNLIKIFEELKYEVKLVKLRKEEEEVIQYFNEVTLKSGGSRNKILRSFEEVILLKKLKKKYRPDIVISNGEYSTIINLLTFTKEKKIATVHSIKSIELKTQKMLGVFCKLGMKYFYKKLDKVVCISEGIKDDLVKNFKSIPQNKIEVIYNYHDLNIIETKAVEELEKEQLEIFDKNKVIVFLGRLSEEKNVENLINSFSKLDECMNLIFVIIGTGLESNKLKKRVKELRIEKKVIFLGEKRNPYKYLKKSKVLVLGSSYEGMPNVIIEAMALNLPILTANSSHGIWEAMSGDKQELKKLINSNQLILENGIIVENLFKNKEDRKLLEKNELKYSEYLNKLISMELKPNNKEKLKRFSYEIILKQYENLISGLKL